MKDYKVRVENEAESEEAQELLFQLGYKWRGGTGTNYLKLQENFRYITAYSCDMRLGQGEKGDADKEITLAELRDLVVLKRNDVGDATHYGNGCTQYYKGEKKFYYWNGNGSGWNEVIGNIDENHLKSITIKEYLNEKCELVNSRSRKFMWWLEVPEGAEEYRANGRFYKDSGRMYASRLHTWKWILTPESSPVYKTIWQRNAPAVSDDRETSQVEHDYKEISQEYKHYKKDVSNLNSIDVYRVLKLFDVKDPALQHAVKKILCAGDRGTKDKVQDIQEAIASLNRFLEMIKEDDDIPF